MINDTDDLDELRAVLRMRADLAPNPDDLIPATRKLARRRRIRRRGMVLSGVVVATALALIGASLLGRPSKPVEPAGGPLVVPAFPFTVGTLPAGLRPTGWESIGSTLTMQPFASHVMTFAGPDDQLTVQSTNYDPALVDQPTGTATESTFLVHGTLATLKSSAGHSWHISWPVGPLAWTDVIVAGDGNSQIHETDIAAIANAITTTPSTPLAGLDIPHLPVGFTAFSWLHSVTPRRAEDEVELCPSLTKSTDEQGCFSVITGHGSVAQATTPLGQPLTERHQIDADHWVGVYPAPIFGGNVARIIGVVQAELRGMLQEASVG
ncbi:MAG TPA: hypothetical protein VGD84_06170 [Pseudonocardiaceae bacterium]